MNQQRPLKFKNKNLKQTLTDNLDMLFLPLVIDYCLFCVQSTRIYGILFFFVFILLTVVLFKQHKNRLNKEINNIIEQKGFKYKISCKLKEFRGGGIYIDSSYLVFCNNFSVDKYSFVKIPVIYEKRSNSEDKVYLDINCELEVWEGKYEEIVDLETNNILTSKELKAFLNQEENREKI